MNAVAPIAPPSPARETPRRPQRIRVLSDGRPGHQNQSLGLAEAIARRTGATIDCLRLPDTGGPPLRWWTALHAPGPPPDLLIGAGHKTHLALWLAARKFKAKSVVIMKPTWPAHLFDLCLVPAHDLAHAPASPRIVPIRGALNRIPEQLPPKQPRGLILLGGPSRSHGWASEALIACLREVCAARPDLQWFAADSRRTPAGFLRSVVQAGVPVQPLPRESTSTSTLMDHLLLAQEVWVTADSVSMIFEAVTTGARVGVLPAPLHAPNSGPARGLEALILEGYATLYATWRQQGRRLPPPRPLHETGRCADLVLTRLFPEERS